MHVVVLVLIQRWPKNVGVIHAKVPFLATQARITYMQFLYLGGTGIADAQARIMLELKCKKINVAVLVSVYSGQKKIWNNSCTSPVLTTQARITYSQFLCIAGNGIADAQVIIMWE